MDDRQARRLRNVGMGPMMTGRRSLLGIVACLLAGGRNCHCMK